MHIGLLTRPVSLERGALLVRVHTGWQVVCSAGTDRDVARLDYHAVACTLLCPRCGLRWSYGRDRLDGWT